MNKFISGVHHQPETLSSAHHEEVCNAIWTNNPQHLKDVKNKFVKWLKKNDNPATGMSVRPTQGPRDT